MSIDRIGRGGAPPAPKPATGAERARGAEAPKVFEVQLERAAPTGSVAPVDRLRAGEVDLDGYLDQKVGEATAHLRGLHPTELEGIRATLRDQLAHDPTLVDLVQQATGQAPASRR